MHIIVGLLVGIVVLAFVFAILTRPLRWIVGIWLLLLGISFVILIGSGLLQKLFGVGGGLFEQYIGMWVVLALYITRRAIIVLLVVSIAYRGLVHLFTRRQAA